MGLANWLTLLRILLIPVFVSLLVYRQRGPALAVFLASVVGFMVVVTGLFALMRYIGKH